MKGEETRSLTRKSRRALIDVPLKAIGLIRSYVPPGLSRYRKSDLICGPHQPMSPRADALRRLRSCVSLLRARRELRSDSATIAPLADAFRPSP
jgi:hypothetical protein